MMKKPSERVHAQMGAAVLARLREFCALPSTGIVAGQAVSSAVLDLLGEKGGGVYNDIDVFVRAEPDAPHDGLDPQTTYAANCPGGGVPLWNSEPGIDEYGRFWLYGVGLYRLIGSRREGMLNIIACAFDSYRSDLMSAEDKLLQGFDLNCVQVAVNLETAELFSTPEFREFVDTKELKVTSLFTPCHTAIRFVRKLDELKVYGNVEQAMALTSLPLVFENDALPFAHPTRLLKLWERKERAFYFGTKMQQTFEKYIDQLGPFFVRERHPELPGLMTLRALRLPTDKLLASLRKMPRLDDPAFVLAASLVYEPHRKAVLARVPHILEHSRSWLRWCFHLRGVSYLRGNIAESDIRLVDKFIRLHSGVELYRLSSFAECLETVLMLKRLEKTVGRWIVGSIESGEVSLFTASTGRGVVRQEADIKMDLEALLPEMHNQLQKPAFKSRRVAGCDVRQMLSRAELIEEGYQMHHCVGGYGSLLKHGDIFISVRNGPRKQDWATVHLRSTSKGCWYISQIKSFANEDPSDKCIAVAKKLTSEISTQSIGRFRYIKEELFHKMYPTIAGLYRMAEGWRYRWEQFKAQPKAYLAKAMGRPVDKSVFEDMDDWGSVPF